MTQELITLRQAAAELQAPPHRIVYALTSKRAPEPLRISGRRMFSRADIARLRRALAGKGAK